MDLWWILSQAWVLPIHLTNSGAPSIHTGLVPAPAGCSVYWEQRPISALMWHHSWRRGQALHKPASWWHQTLLSAEEAVDCPCWVVWMWFPFLIPPPLLELRGYLMYQDTITHCIVVDQGTHFTTNAEKLTLRLVGLILTVRDFMRSNSRDRGFICIHSSWEGMVSRRALAQREAGSRKDGLEVRSTHCSCRRLRCDSQKPTWWSNRNAHNTHAWMWSKHSQALRKVNKSKTNNQKPRPKKQQPEAAGSHLERSGSRERTRRRVCLPPIPTLTTFPPHAYPQRFTSSKHPITSPNSATIWETTSGDSVDILHANHNE